MDTKMQALEKAQKMHTGLVAEGFQSDIFHLQAEGRFCVSVDNKVIHGFEYSDPKPLEKDTLCMCSDGIMRYAIGELNKDGVNKFYAQGFCSKNVGIGYHNYMFKDFEIIETPSEFERVQTPDHECINSGCARYVNKWQRVESDKFLSGDCERCTILVGTPSNIKTRK